MRITTKGRYALRAALALARQPPGVPVSISQLGEEEHISSVFLEQIFFKLRKKGIVDSIRGPGGGFVFAKPPDKLCLREILEAAGEELNVTNCDKHAKACDQTGLTCSSHAVWEDISRIIGSYLEQVTLSMVLRREETPRAFSTKIVPYLPKPPEDS